MAENEKGNYQICSPGEQKRLSQALVDVDDEIIVGDGVDIRTGELAIDQDSLQQQISHELVSFDANQAQRSTVLFAQEINKFR